MFGENQVTRVVCFSVQSTYRAHLKLLNEKSNVVVVFDRSEESRRRI